MKPNKEGVYSWLDDDGVVQNVHVLNVNSNFIGEKQWLRVYYMGGYYNVHDEEIGTPDEEYCKSEWPDRWVGYVGPLFDENNNLRAGYGV